MTLDDRTAHQLLDDEHADLLHSLRSVASDLSEEETGAGDELAHVDQHPADMGTEMHDMERDLGLRADLRRRVDENRAALDRLESGGYGICERCGRPIGDDRLRAVPSARYCVDDELATAAGR